MSMLVVGSLNIDLVAKVAAFPKEGETVMGTSMERISGGKGANQAVACGKLGAKTTILGAVGQDEAAAILKESLANASVITEKLLVVENAFSGTALICVTEQGENNIVVIPGANQKMDIGYLQANDDAFCSCSALLLQMEIPFACTLYAAKRANELKKTVLLNLAPVPDYDVQNIFPYVDYLSVNESELEKISNRPADTIESISAAAGALLRKGVRNVLVTLGHRGAFLKNQHEEILVPPPEVTVKDTTAAGDTFNAAFLVKRVAGATCRQAMEFANCSAALAVSKAGAQSSIPTWREAEALYKDSFFLKGDE